VLRLHDISLKLGRFRLRRVNLNVRAGEYRVLLGPTGTGKTVLIETIAGLHRPDDGRIFLDGRDVTTVAPEARHLGVVYQDYALFPHLNVFNNIAFGLRLQGGHGRRLRDAVHEISAFLDVGHILDRTPTHLSGGERQRVALARVLVLKPLMLLLDEPLSAVDRLTRDRLQKELKRIHNELGLTILHITHDLNEAFLLADRLTMMKDGAVLQEGTPEEISKHPASRFVAQLLGIENFLPARVEEGKRLFLEGLGAVDPHILSPWPSGHGKIFITIPGWAVEFPDGGEPGQYWWRGTMKIVTVVRTSTSVEVRLGGEKNTSLCTAFSRREADQLPFELVPGNSIEVGLPKKGIHWVARDETA
jgi:ABC-type sugar transport system ATPase subunit